MANVTNLNRVDFWNYSIGKIEKNIDTLLDIGTGIKPSGFIHPKLYICVEPFHEYFDILDKQTKEQSDQLYLLLNSDWEDALKLFPEKSVDTIFLLDVIEHLEKDIGEKLLRLTEKVARKQVVIFTPLGFIEQHTLHGGKDAWGLNGATWQEHKSGWLPDDFDSTWDLYICDDFHSHNNVGEELDKPVGAIWAIKNINNEELNNQWIKHGDLSEQLLSNYLRIINKFEDSLDKQSKDLNNAYREMDALYKEVTNLNALVSERQNANAELQNANAELQNANAELQSANAELQNANAELQNANAELQNANAELQNANAELQNRNAELQNVNLEL